MNSEIYGGSIPCDLPGEVVSSTATGSRITTGGGFSNVFSTPAYQAEFVSNYLPKTNIPLSYYNPNGRGYPDVSTVGHNLLCVLGGQLTTIDGTSASGPVFGGLVSLLNDAMLNAGFNSLGLMNPALYKAKQILPQAFRDIVTGSNKDGDIQGRCSKFPIRCEFGFHTQPGWNPVTGLGSPNWSVLRDYFLNAAKFRKQEREQANNPNKAKIL